VPGWPLNKPVRASPSGVFLALVVTVLVWLEQTGRGISRSPQGLEFVHLRATAKPTTAVALVGTSAFLGASSSSSPMSALGFSSLPPRQARSANVLGDRLSAFTNFVARLKRNSRVIKVLRRLSEGLPLVATIPVAWVLYIRRPTCVRVKFGGYPHTLTGKLTEPHAVHRSDGQHKAKHSPSAQEGKKKKKQAAMILRRRESPVPFNYAVR